VYFKAIDNNLQYAIKTDVKILYIIAVYAGAENFSVNEDQNLQKWISLLTKK
jgi:hypothetical protein